MREADRLTKLMAETDSNNGIPASFRFLESQSENTREHPIKALKHPGVAPETSNALVTSGWHMRRAKREFSHYFYNVQSYPALQERHVFRWSDLIPNVDVLAFNTSMLLEWAGILWYEIS